MRCHVIAFGVVAMLGVFAGPASMARGEAVFLEARLPLPPPLAALPGKLAPELAATVAVGGSIEGFTEDGRTRIEVPEGIHVGELRDALREVQTVRRITPADDTPIEPLRELVVLFDEGVDMDAFALPVRGLRAAKPYERGRRQIVRASRPITADQLRQLADLPGVRYVEPCYRYRFTASEPPNDPMYLSDQLKGLVHLRAPSAWRAVRTSPVRVAILDTGISLHHPDLAPNLWSNSGEEDGLDGVDDDGNGFIDDVRGWDFLAGDNDPADEALHGSGVAGVVAARGNNLLGMVGVAWALKLMAIRIGQPGVGSGCDEIERGIDYAIDNGARVLTAAWFVRNGHSILISDAIERARKKGALFVTTAGREGIDIDENPIYPASYTHDNIVVALGVNAETGTDELFSGSGWGETSVDIGAPATEIVTTAIWTGDEAKAYQRGLVGTSYAVAHVAGALALIWGHPDYRGKSALEVREALLAHARSLPPLENKCVSNGTVDLEFLRPPDPH